MEPHAEVIVPIPPTVPAHFGRVAQLFPLWFLRQTHRQRVSLDENEGVVKVHESCAEGTVNEPVWLRTRTLEHSLGITSGWKPVPPTVDSAPTAAMILLCEHPATAGCESAQSIPTVWLATGGPAFSHFGCCMNLPDKGCPALANPARERGTQTVWNRHKNRNRKRPGHPSRARLNKK